MYSLFTNLSFEQDDDALFQTIIRELLQNPEFYGAVVDLYMGISEE
jgi:hypothetical protein